MAAGGARGRRGDFYARTAARIVAKNALVVLEDLRIKNMSASACGTVAEPARNVRQKAGLNRAILDKGGHRLELALTNAARYTGTRVVKVNPAYPSQRCSTCGFVTETNRESQAVFWCKAHRGHRDHADVNAAKKRSTATSAGRSSPRSWPRKSSSVPGSPPPSAGGRRAERAHGLGHREARVRRMPPGAGCGL
ncbi:hypothetical protein GCM10010260_81190 [Streptomyces filipinensis]|uniref:Cas12f1-like TNB domain-containing protein n=1 Tax=Streptomyces filipinensis TaxID=66887 RepID=A0A918IJU9_9ACTN|nr:hypothetical protein GCM10010260_81190 [Streptomyces filipinensis]